MVRRSALALALSLYTALSALGADLGKAEDIYLNTVLNLRQVDISTYTEVDIHAPASVVWKYLADMRQAARYSPAEYRLETGKWGEIDSVVEAHHTGRPYPQYRQKTIDIIPNKYLVFRMSSRISEDAVETFNGYDVITLLESGGITKVIFIQPLTFGNLALKKEELAAFKEGQKKFIRPIFEDLKRLVEKEYKP